LEINSRSTSASPPPGHLLNRRDILRWQYLGRVTLVSGILAGAFVEWLDVQPHVSLVATVMFLLAVSFTGGSFWHTHVRGREPGAGFLYTQVGVDVALVTTIVHVTGGPDSSFAPVYILVISVGALLLPVGGGILMGVVATLAYFADITLAHGAGLTVGIGLQVALFLLIAVVAALVGDRVRRTGAALGAVESELRQLRLDTGDILATMSTGILTVDGEGRLAYANPAAEALLGLDAEEWMGRLIMGQLDELAPGLGEVLRRGIEEGERTDRYQTASNRRGEQLLLGVSTAVLERGDASRPSATAIFQDITDLELLDVVHRRAERLEAVAKLSASMAHEIKNPLASIRSAVEQLTRPEPLNGRDREILRRLILTESDRLSRVLSEFLEYSGLRKGKTRTIDLSLLTRDCADLLRQHPAAEGIDVVVRGADRPVPMVGDADLLHRALFNLLLNGAQFAGDEGTVTVSVADLRGEENPRGTGIREAVGITVGDTGPGVEAEVADRLFDPFFTTRVGGSGLGLAMVHRAVEVHEGAIFVEKSPEGGAQFAILLPASADGERGVQL
jgi:two-component system sensor histidine kinase PilS (NtrC family)